MTQRDETLRVALTRRDRAAGAGADVCVWASRRRLRLGRRLRPSAADGWRVEVEIEVPDVDPEQVLCECEDFLVDGLDGREIGVVDQVETSAATGRASALFVAAGWFGRRRLRIDAHAVMALLPADRRVIVDESRVYPAGGGGRPH